MYFSEAVKALNQSILVSLVTSTFDAASVRVLMEETSNGASEATSSGLREKCQESRD